MRECSHVNNLAPIQPSLNGQKKKKKPKNNPHDQLQAYQAVPTELN